MHKIKSLGLFSLAVFGGAAGLAANARAADVVLAPVLVRGDSLQELDADSPANPFRVAPSSRASVQVLTAEDIAAFKPRDVFDLLAHAVGVFPMYQGRKVPVHLQIRGDTNYAFIIDGAYLERDTGARILGNLPVSAIEQVEVVRDSTALSLGPMVNFTSPSGAPNDGFIVIRTKRPTRSGGQFKASVESFGTESIDISGAVASEENYLGGVFRQFSTDGPKDQYAAADSLSGLVKGGFRRERLAFDAMAYHDSGSFQFQRADQAISTAALTNMKWSFDPIETTLLVANARLNWNDEHTSLLSFHYNELKSTFQQGSFSSPVVTLHDNKEETWGGSLRHTFRYGNTLLQLGGQFNHWETPTGQLFYEYNPRREEIIGGFVQAEQRLFDDRLTLDGAYRRDQKKVIEGVDSYGHAMSYPNSVIHDRLMPVAEFLSLGASWKPLKEWLLNLRYAYGHQGANISVVTDPGVVLGDETQQKYEISTSYGGFEYIKPKFSLFQTDVSNYKYPTRFDSVTQQAVYAQADASRSGFELEFTGHLGQATHWHLAWTHFIKDNMVDDHGRSAPDNLGVFDVSHQWGAWEFNGALQRVDTYTSNFFSPGGEVRPIGDYTRLDLNATRSLRIAELPVKLSIYGRNVSGEKYQTQLGYRAPGAIFGTSLEVSF